MSPKGKSMKWNHSLVPRSVFPILLRTLKSRFWIPRANRYLVNIIF